MPLLLRKIEWRHWQRSSRDDVRADALMDLRTSRDSLSVYKISEDCDTARVSTALAATRDHLENLEYAVFPDLMLESFGISIERRLGDTADAGVNQVHYDLVDLTTHKVMVLADMIYRAGLERINWKVVRKMIVDEINTGTLNAGSVNEKLLDKVKSELSV